MLDYKPSILGSPHFRNPPHGVIIPEIRLQLTKNSCSCYAEPEVQKKSCDRSAVGQLRTWCFFAVKRGKIWGFPLMGIPQNEWFIMENTLKYHENWWFGGTSISGHLHLLKVINLNFRNAGYLFDGPFWIHMEICLGDLVLLERIVAA